MCNWYVFHLVFLGAKLSVKHNGISSLKRIIASARQVPLMSVNHPTHNNGFHHAILYCRLCIFVPTSLRCCTWRLVRRCSAALFISSCNLSMEPKRSLNAPMPSFTNVSPARCFQNFTFLVRLYGCLRHGEIHRLPRKALNG